MNIDRQYPIGPFLPPKCYDEVLLSAHIETIRQFPSLLASATSNLSPSDIDAPYRSGGWTVRQLVHHCADSHMNSFIRFKLALTEENPMIKPYLEDKWAEMEDYLTVPISTSLQLIEVLHARWVVLLKSMTRDDFEKTFFHPEKKRSTKLFEATALYAWHCNHHLAHVMLVVNSI